MTLLKTLRDEVLAVEGRGDKPVVVRLCLSLFKEYADIVCDKYPGIEGALQFRGLPVWLSDNVVYDVLCDIQSQRSERVKREQP